MKLTTEEMRDMVANSIIAFLAHRGEMDVNTGVDIVNWVDTQDFEFRLEAMREDW
ncbi:MAG: hypothetical protein J6J23_06610 [Clostridia bacterium]|nr:hypothetical protein [Clostridia bacterium]